LEVSYGKKALRPNGEPYRGVYYREHPTRKHGLYPDRYYLIRYRALGKGHNEGLGWGSEGIKPSAAQARLIEIKASLKAGTFETLSDRKAREAKAREQEERDRMTFGVFWIKIYLPAVETTRRPETLRREKQHFKTRFHQSWPTGH